MRAHRARKSRSIKAKIAGTPLALAVAAGLSMTTTTVSAQTITVWSGYPEMAPFYEHVAESMKDEYPDLQVNVEAIALREHEKRIALGLTSGSAGVTVIELAGSTASRYIENDLIPAAPENVAAFVKDPANFGSFFVETASKDGTVYGVPLFRGQGALFYNVDMFEAAGLTEPPRTMEEYTEYAEKLTQRNENGNPTVSGWSLRLTGGGQGIAEKFWINLFQYGGSVIEPDGNGKWRANYANEAGRKALKQYLENVHVLKTVTPEMPADAEAFERGQTAMFIRESWVIGDIAAKAPDLNYATAPLPRGSIALPTNLYVNSVEGEDAEAAWAFALATNEPENLIWLLDNVGWLPNRSGVDYSVVTDRVPAFAAFVDYPEDYEFFTLPAIGPIEEVLTRLAGQLTAAYANADLAQDDAAIDAFLASAAEETNNILSREGLLAE
ncbi:extracellular solute-binding protein [Chelativorans sp. SCAU2101]|uniref:Extracellular solute-binding protein n=1 Tax=Chelativorans petroleitrophicus TaxID=2975484 RepID=A0A9X3AZW3_9HYPH|nr:extracellular solute-binding protein [Chelativorans petroleitrophicus]MCT8990364.1 extracellular solute-binding protein [Chelativorans petroleitrophicus]